MKKPFRKIIKVFCFVLVCIFSGFSFAGCVGYGFTPSVSSDSMNEVMNKASAETKKDMIAAFKNNFNGIKIVYIPDEPSESDIEGEFNLISSISQVALTKFKDDYADYLLKYADFYWKNNTSANKLTANSTASDNAKFYLNNTPTATSIKYENDWKWFDGTSWRILTAVPNETNKFTYSDGSSTKYFYIDPNVSSPTYFYNTTETYTYSSETSVSLSYAVNYFYISNGAYYKVNNYDFLYSNTVIESLSKTGLELYVGDVYVESNTTLVADLAGFITKFKNKLTAAFVNSIMSLDATNKIPTSLETDGTTSAYVSLIKNRLANFEYFGLQDDDIEAGKAFIENLIKEIKNIPSITPGDENEITIIFNDSGAASSEVPSTPATEASVVGLLNSTLGKQWQYNIYIDNYTMDDLQPYFENDKQFMGARKYLSIVYMTKNSFAPYYNKDTEKPKSETTKLYPDECTLLFKTEADEADVNANFMFKGAGLTASEYSHGFDVVHTGDVMVDADGNAYKDENGKETIYDGDNALSLEIFTKMSDVQNVFVLSSAFTTENDETKNGSTWSGTVSTYTGTKFNTSITSSISQVEAENEEHVKYIKCVKYVSETHDVLQIVFDKANSFDLAGIGSLLLYDAEQIDWDVINQIMGD